MAELWVFIIREEVGTEFLELGWLQAPTFRFLTEAVPVLGMLRIDTIEFYTPLLWVCLGLLIGHWVG